MDKVIMIRITDNIFIGGQSDCRNGDMAVVHACKIPCHREAIGYKNNLPDTHPNYLHYIRGNNLYLNIIDPEIPLFKIETFRIFLDFADEHRGKILIHCNQGGSRAPSLAMLLMAARSEIVNESYKAAYDEFCWIHPYKPGSGIARFLSERWDEIIRN